MIKKIDHINIVVSDLQSATKFFTDLLGFEVSKEGHLSGKWIDKVVGLKNVDAKYVQLIIPGSETNMELIQYYNPQSEADKNISKSNQIGFRHMALEVKNIEEIYTKLQQASVRILSELQVYNQTKKLCYFLGPDNVILELAEYDE